jgi:hypothetical protein
VFFNLNNKVVLKPKVVYYLKAPIVTDSLDIANTKCTPYNKIYHTMNVAEKHGYRTYFYKKANTLNYYSTSKNEMLVLVTDYLNNIYKTVNLDKTGIIVKSERNIVIGLNSKNWYLVAEEADLGNEKNCLVITSLNDGRILYRKSRSDKNMIYLNYYYPIHDVIVPILMVTKHGISIELYNILNEQVYSTNLIDLKALRELADIAIKIEGKNVDMTGEDVEAIQHAKVQEPRYRVCTEQNKLMCLNNVYVSLSLELKLSKSYIVDYKEQNYLYTFENLQINVYTDSNKVYCKLDLSKAYFEIHKAHYSETAERIVKDTWDSTILAFFYDKNRDLMLPYMNKYEYPYEIHKDKGCIYLSTYIYGNKCYKIINNERGVNIAIRDNELVSGIEKTSTIYKQKDYLFVLRNDLIGHIDLIIIDTIRKLICVIEEDIKISFTGEGGKTLEMNMLNCLLWFVYYYKKYNSFIFISNNYRYLLLVRADEIEKAFNDVSVHECGENLALDGIVRIYDILDLIFIAIESYAGKMYKQMIFYILGHYLDAEADKLCLLVKYVTGRERRICLLELAIIDNTPHFNVLYINNEKAARINIGKTRIKNNYINDKFMAKLSMSGRNNKFMKDLDMLYTGNGTFVSIRYNRESPRIDELVKSYYGYLNGYITCSLASQYHYGDLVIFKYECKHKKRIYRNQFQTTEDYNDYNFVLVNFVIVKRMSTTNATFLETFTS